MQESHFYGCVCFLSSDVAGVSQSFTTYSLFAVLKVLARVDNMHKDSVASDVHQALMVLMNSIINNWRCQAHLAAALPALPGLLGADVLAEQWTPFAFNLLLTGKSRCSPDVM